MPAGHAGLLGAGACVSRAAVDCDDGLLGALPSPGAGLRRGVAERFRRSYLRDLQLCDLGKLALRMPRARILVPAVTAALVAALAALAVPDATARPVEAHCMPSGIAVAPVTVPGSEATASSPYAGAASTSPA